ncbi:MAG TPA: circularly permuted type 2 ATP-grasp protein, partial [Myxococcota bacterium]|nr:circularly permuted type 2 ATP-grasp protein [Myxococcota bacterium]
VQAVRAGNVAVANALGSGLAESPALLAFLPGLARALLGEELALPSVATWWCGEERALDYVEAHLPELVVKTTFPSARLEPVFGARLSAAERAAFVAQIRARPHGFVAQEQVALSTAPVFAPEGVRARPLVLRAYAAASRDRSWEVMPGGLTRVAVAPDSLVVSMQRGGGSKDTWVCSAGTPNAITLLRPAGAPLELTRGGAELPSRVADNLFWLGRYVERVEGAARLARAIIARISGEGAEQDGSLRPLVEALARSGAIEEGASHEGRAFLDRVFASDSPRSVRATLAAVHQLAFVLRDQLSLDTWRVLSELQGDASGPSAASWSLSAARDALNRMIVRLSAWSGLTMESMTRTLGWRFADMGRRIERGSWIATLLDVCLVEAGDDEPARLEALLEVAESAITYRRRYRSELQAVAVLDLLHSDETNPRSLAFQLAALEQHLEQVRGIGPSAERTPAERIALAALSRVRLADVAGLCRVEDAKRLRLAELLARTLADLPALSDALTRSYLSHAGEARRIERF